MNARRLAKTRDKWMDGVVGGIARYFGWNPDVTRLIAAVLILGTGGFMLLVYLVMMVIMPGPNPHDEEWSGPRITRTNGPLAGVCGGIANYFHWDPTLVRLVTLVSIFATGVVLLVYLILAVAMPRARTAW